MKLYRLLLLLTLQLSAFFIPVAADESKILVTTRTLQNIAITQKYSVPARVLSLNDSNISSEIVGKILTITPKVGDSIKLGDTIASIDCYSYQLTLTQQLANLVSLQAKLKLISWQVTRAKQLAANHNTSQELLQTQQSNLTQITAAINNQNAQIANMKRTVQNCKITAPFSGIISERYTNKGELVNIGSKIVRLIDLNNIEVSAQLYVNQINNLPNAENNLYFIGNNIKFPVTLRKIVANVNSNTSGQIARFIFKNSNNNLPLPGTSGRLTWQNMARHIPASYLQKRDNTLGVFIVENDYAKFIVLTDAIAGKPTITSLSGDTKLIDHGKSVLKDFSKIIIQDNAAE